MDENRLYNILIIACLIAIITVTVLIFTNKTTEPFTELFFENHVDLPKEINLEQDYYFQFTIHNLENKPTHYSYSITLDTDNKIKVLDQSQILLQHDQAQTIPVIFQIDEPFQEGKISVDLLNKNQKIHFWVKP